MSKMDNLRAMREARHEKATKQPATKAPPRPRASPDVEPGAAPAAAPPVDASEDGLCGHRSISGRTCTREKGHAAKSHRYA
jgi:hypothetical protein